MTNSSASAVQVLRLRPAAVDDSLAADMSRLMTFLAGAPRVISAAELRRVARINHLAVALTDEDEFGRRRIVGAACLVAMPLPQGVNLLIESVVVDPSFQGRGLGLGLMQALLAAAERRYPGRTVSLTSNPSRTKAHALFEGLGFARAQTSVFRRPPAR